VIRASIGVAVSDPDDEITADGLLRNADAAMYVAKAKGRSRVEVFDPEIHREVIDRLRLETELRAALLDRRQLHIQYQPVVDLSSGLITGFEALVRWRHPVRGLIGPDTFIPVAEEVCLITQIGVHVLRRACGTAAELQKRFGRPLSVGVNVSPRQFLDPAFPGDVARSLALAGLPAEQLLIEITETSLLRDVDAAISVLEELRALGVRVAIDDFGTGYSSLGYLRRLPVDVLKVDRSFVREVDGSAEESAVARAVITLARTFRLEAIAEGIERPRQLAALVRLGCKLGQGYLFAEPLERDKLEEYIAKGAFAKTAGPDDHVTRGHSQPTVLEDEGPTRAASGES
jgi:EAL domain-containing protein (putative c-di-GMP-specific phosphodiesterase class I)